ETAGSHVAAHGDHPKETDMTSLKTMMAALLAGSLVATAGGFAYAKTDGLAFDPAQMQQRVEKRVDKALTGTDATAEPKKKIADTARDGEALLKRESFDAVILDLMLPDADGLDLCRRLRATTDVPILMLTARGEPMDRVVGLEIGADDYLAKPFEPRELQARLRAILRRKGTPAKAEVLRFGRLEIDKGARSVRLDGEERPLTGYQFT